MSAKKFIDQRVALEARRLLAHSADSVVSIATALGFSEPTNFAKFFRREVGLSPAEFRARFQGTRMSTAPSGTQRAY